jgi:hypothetical protein
LPLFKRFSAISRRFPGGFPAFSGIFGRFPGMVNGILGRMLGHGALALWAI